MWKSMLILLQIGQKHKKSSLDDLHMLRDGTVESDRTSF
jgi:hypothetical protein